LRPDSAGAGRWRGGLATSRTFRVNAPEIIVNALFDRTRTHGPGIFGGQVGASSGIFIQRPGDDRFRRFSETFGTVSDSKFTRVAVTEGDRIQLDSAGGGGLGDPRQRPRELVAEDVRQGVVSPEVARQLYGYDIDDEGDA
jgi:N-methylhydantoinase B/oxoprolinase/acetone carboxylase alpha subunit